MDKRLKKYFTLEYRHKKSSVAHLLDSVMACIAAFLSSTIFIWSMGARLTASIIFGICFTIAAIAISRAVYLNRFEKLAKKLTLQAMDELARERFCFSSEAKALVIREIKKSHNITGKVKGGVICGDEIFFISIRHPLSKFETEHAFNMIKEFNGSGAKGFYLLTACEISPEASQMILRHGGKISKGEIDEVIKGFMPSVKEAEEYLIKKYDEEKITTDKLKKSFTQKNKTKGWVLCTIMLILWGIIFSKGAIYFTSAGICATLAAYCALSNKGKD